MNKKQLIVALGIGVIIAFLIGFQLTHIKLEDVSFYTLLLYGIKIIGDYSYSRNPVISVSLLISEYRLLVLFLIVSIGGLLIYTLRDKKN